MFGFLLKIFFLVMIVGGVLGYIYVRNGALPQLPTAQQLQSDVDSIRNGQAPQFTKNVDVGSITGQLSSALDNLVTHPDKNSPVVLGIKITNESLNSLVDLIHNMPPEQSQQLKDIICAPVTSETPASPSSE